MLSHILQYPLFSIIIFIYVLNKSKINQGLVKIDVRKLISFGKGSYIVSMPKDCVIKNNLKKGDLISVNDNGFELTLSANTQDKKSESKV